MISLLTQDLPCSVEVAGVALDVRTDFRDWIRFALLLSDKEITDRDKLSLLPCWFVSPPEIFTALHLMALRGFYAASELDPDRDAGEEEEPYPGPPCFDWQYDARYVLGDFRHYYGIDLMQESLHWWAFRALFTALPPESRCMERIYYRTADLSLLSEGERKRIRRIRAAIALPFEMSDEMIGAALGGL